MSQRNSVWRLDISNWRRNQLPNESSQDHSSNVHSISFNAICVSLQHSEEYNTMFLSLSCEQRTSFLHFVAHTNTTATDTRLIHDVISSKRVMCLKVFADSIHGNQQQEGALLAMMHTAANTSNLLPTSRIENCQKEIYKFHQRKYIQCITIACVILSTSSCWTSQTLESTSIMPSLWMLIRWHTKVRCWLQELERPQIEIVKFILFEFCKKTFNTSTKCTSSNLICNCQLRIEVNSSLC